MLRVVEARKSAVKILYNYRATGHASSPRLTRQIDRERDGALTDPVPLRKTDRQRDRNKAHAHPHVGRFLLSSLRKFLNFLIPICELELDQL